MKTSKYIFVKTNSCFRGETESEYWIYFRSGFTGEHKPGSVWLGTTKKFDSGNGISLWEGYLPNGQRIVVTDKRSWAADFLADYYKKSQKQ